MSRKNGQTSQAKITHEHVLQARRRVALTEAEIRQVRLERAKKLIEAVSLNDIWLSAYTERLDQFSRQPDSFAGTTHGRGRHGQNYPLFSTEGELANYRDRARLLVEWNEYAQGIVRGLTSYMLGDGMTYRITSKSNRHPAPDELLDACQQVVDEFLLRSGWHGGEMPGLEEELFRRSIRDGEFFLVHFNDGNATHVRVAEPEHITQKPGESFETWGFGIQSPIDDVATHLAYWWQPLPEPEAGEELSADRVVHFRRNVDRNVKRGLTDFCGGTQDALHNSSQLRKLMTEGAAIQASYSGVRQHANNTKTQVEDMRTLAADYTTRNPITGNTEYHQQHKAGMVDIPAGMEFVNPPTATNAAAHVQILQACLRGAGRKWCAPEWLASGDSSNNNYSSSLVAASDFVKTVTANQRAYEKVFAMSPWAALRNRVERTGLSVPMIERDADGKDTGRRNERVFAWGEIQQLVKLDVKAPSPIAQDKLQEAQANEIYNRIRVKSQQTIMSEQGLDVEQEIVNQEEFQERLGEAGLQLPLPGETGASMLSLPDEKEGEPSTDAASAALDAAAEASTPSETANALRATVGGSSAIIGLQKEVYAGTLPREAAMANAKLMFGFSDIEVDQLFPLQPATQDAAGRGWVTMPANGPDKGGSPVYVDDDTGEITKGNPNAIKAAKQAQDHKATKEKATKEKGDKDVHKIAHIGQNILMQAAQRKEEEEENAKIVNPPATAHGKGDGELPVPDIRQQTEYSCGPACLKAIAEYFGMTVPEATLRSWSDTDPEDGSEPKDLAEAAKGLGLNAAVKTGLTVEDLADSLDRGHPVIVGVAAWGEDQEETGDGSGHYVVVTGLDVDAGTITLQDPARDPKAGKVTIPLAEFKQNWELPGENPENPVHRLGIVVSKPGAGKGKSDDWVSAKIAKLRSEGYDEDQAVAIAYHMAGRGKQK